MTRSPDGSLWVVTSFFNPAGYCRKLANFRRFRERLGAPLVAVELGFDGRFSLEPRDADVLVRVQDGDVMWQKERLLNIGIGAVPSSCDTVAWVDCDVIFGMPDWPSRARAALERDGLVHLFRDRHNLPRDAPIDRLATWPGPATSVSAVHKLATGAASPDDLTRNNSTLEIRATSGLAWAMRRETLARLRLYDACIVGGGDRTILCAALGRFDLAVRAQRMNARRAEHYLAWARPFFAAVDGRVESLPGAAFHLWHGQLEDRRYATRADHLADFDPFSDIAPAADGCWRWSSDKPGLHAALRQYFHDRDEDGEARRAAVARPGAMALGA